jgi:hypothetical protein
MVSVQTEIDSATSGPVQFGRQVMRASPQREYFKGAIDEVYIADQALDGASIRTLANDGFAPLNAPKPK